MVSSMKRTCQAGDSAAAMTRSPCGGMKARTPSISGYAYSKEPNDGAYRGKKQRIRALRASPDTDRPSYTTSFISRPKMLLGSCRSVLCERNGSCQRDGASRALLWPVFENLQETSELSGTLSSRTRSPRQLLFGGDVKWLRFEAPATVHARWRAARWSGGRIWRVYSPIPGAATDGRAHAALLEVGAALLAHFTRTREQPGGMQVLWGSWPAHLSVQMEDSPDIWHSIQISRPSATPLPSEFPAEDGDGLSSARPRGRSLPISGSVGRVPNLVLLERNQYDQRRERDP
jgi:hypothetical protein